MRRPRLVSRWTTVRGWRLHTRVSTAAAPPEWLPVVLVHGLGVSSRYMVPTARRLARHTRVLAPDLPGFGRSSKPPRTLGTEELADVLAAWMEAVGLERAAFLGNSFGCQILVELARRHPARVDRLVLVGPTVDPRAARPVVQMLRAALDVPLEPFTLLPIVLKDYLRAGPGRCWRTLVLLCRHPMAERLEDVPVPTLVVRGERDPIVPTRWAREAAQRLPQGRLTLAPGAAHAVNYNSPSALVQAILPFLTPPSPEQP